MSFHLISIAILVALAVAAFTFSTARFRDRQPSTSPTTATSARSERVVVMPTAGGRLEVAAVAARETFTRAAPRLLFDLVDLGTTVSEVRANAARRQGARTTLPRPQSSPPLTIVKQGAGAPCLNPTRLRLRARDRSRTCPSKRARSRHVDTDWTGGVMSQAAAKDKAPGCLAIFLVGVVIFGGIGALFGTTGFLIGTALALLVAATTASENQKTAAKLPAPGIPTPTPPLEPQRPMRNDSLYGEVVPEALAACVAADGNIQAAAVRTANDLMDSDELLTDKSKALQNFQTHLVLLHSKRMKSKAVFDLATTTVIDKARDVTDRLHKARLASMLKGMVETLEPTKRSETQAFVDQITAAFGTSAAVSRKQAAEDYILRSGDSQALNALRQMKSNPATYGKRLKEAASSNSIMKTALGVFTGMIAAELVTGAIRSYQLDQALAKFDDQLASIGGLENLQLAENLVAEPIATTTDTFEPGAGATGLDALDPSPAEALDESVARLPDEMEAEEAADEAERLDAPDEADDSSDAFDFGEDF